MTYHLAAHNENLIFNGVVRTRINALFSLIIWPIFCWKIGAKIWRPTIISSDKAMMEMLFSTTSYLSTGLLARSCAGNNKVVPLAFGLHLDPFAPHESDIWFYRRIHHVKFLAFHGNQLEYNGS